MKEAKVRQASYYMIHSGNQPLAIRNTRSEARKAKREFVEAGEINAKIMHVTVYTRKVR
jgi:hypothetical protein